MSSYRENPPRKNMFCDFNVCVVAMHKFHIIKSSMRVKHISLIFGLLADIYIELQHFVQYFMDARQF